jgi:hypothetical protein
MQEHGERYAKTGKSASSQSGWGCLAAGLLAALAFGALWLLIAAVKWMWQHS